MPNVNAARGLVPIRTNGTGEIVTNAYSILTSYATALYIGDPVMLTGTGRNIAIAPGGTTNSIGVFAGCRYTDSTGKPVWSRRWPGVSDGKTDIVAFVWDDPNIVWEIQADGIVEAEVGQVADWAIVAGDPKSGLSKTYAVVSGTTTTTGGSLKIQGLVPSPKNEYGPYAKIQVIMLEHANNGVVAGVGGV